MQEKLAKSVRGLAADVQALQRSMDQHSRDIEEIRHTHEPKLHALLAQGKV